MSATFLETIRDFNQTGAGCRPTVTLAEQIRSNTAHEVLHALRLGHGGDNSGGLMCSALKNYATQPRRLDVTEKQRARLRGATAEDGFVLTRPFAQNGLIPGDNNYDCDHLPPS